MTSWAVTIKRVVATVVLATVAVVCVAGASGSSARVPGVRCAIGSLAVHAPHVVILKSRRVLCLFDGPELVRTYPIDLGSEPIGTKRIGADRRTPEGRFYVATKNANSPYHRFLGLSYPGEAAIRDGLAAGLISPGEAADLRATRARGACPGWTTALGGGIGIHGHRRRRDWTGGCVALDDAQVDELYRVLRIGDPVEILP